MKVFSKVPLCQINRSPRQKTSTILLVTNRVVRDVRKSCVEFIYGLIRTAFFSFFSFHWSLRPISSLSCAVIFMLSLMQREICGSFFYFVSERAPFSTQRVANARFAWYITVYLVRKWSVSERVPGGVINDKRNYILINIIS